MVKFWGYGASFPIELGVPNSFRSAQLPRLVRNDILRLVCHPLGCAVIEVRLAILTCGLYRMRMLIQSECIALLGQEHGACQRQNLCAAPVSRQDQWRRGRRGFHADRYLDCCDILESLLVDSDPDFCHISP